MVITGVQHYNTRVYCCFARATIANANIWKTAFTSFRFAKIRYLTPFLFGYVPVFSLDGSVMDIVVFALVMTGTFQYAWFLCGIWVQYFR